MAQTYPEQVEEWESLITGHHSRMATRLMKQDTEAEAHRTAARGWRVATDLADEILGELKAWRGEAAGHEASRALLQERFDDQSQQLREVTSRLSWLEEHARRMKRYLEERATCSVCGRYDLCEENCDARDWMEEHEQVVEAREALNGFAL